MFIVSIIVASVLSFVALLHFYWSFGGLYGLHSAGPKLEGEKDFVPPKFIIFIVACLIAGLAALAILLEVPNIPFKNMLTYIGYLVSVVFILRSIGDFKYVGFFKTIYNSNFSKNDTFFFSPLCLMLGIAFAILSKY